MLTALHIAVNNPSTQNLSSLEKSISDVDRVSKTLASSENGISPKEASVLLSAVISREHQGNTAAFKFLYDIFWNERSAIKRNFRDLMADAQAIHHRLSALENGQQGSSASVPSGDANSVGAGDMDVQQLESRVRKLEQHNNKQGYKHFDKMHSRLDEVEKLLVSNERYFDLDGRLCKLEEDGNHCRKQLDQTHKTLTKHGDHLNFLATTADDSNNAALASKVHSLRSKVDQLSNRVDRVKMIPGEVHTLNQQTAALKNKVDPLKGMPKTLHALQDKVSKLEQHRLVSGTKLEVQERLITALRAENAKISGQLSQVVEHLVKAGIMAKDTIET